MTWFLRQATEAGMTTVGSELTWAQVDANFVKAKRFIASLLDAMNIPAYLTTTTYQPGTYVRHNLQLWLQIRATSSINIDPGTDASVWREASPSELAHVAGTDIKLRTPAGVDVMAVDVKAVTDTGLRVITVSVTSSELRNLSTAPKLLVAAVSGKTLVPISCIATTTGTTPSSVNRYTPALILIRNAGSNTGILVNESVLDSAVNRTVNFAINTIEAGAEYTAQYQVSTGLELYAPVDPKGGTFGISLTLLYHIV
jgi:hypothetical protein